MTLAGTLEPIVERDRVRFVFRVHNRGTETVELTFPTGQTADVIVCVGVEPTDPVWEWSDDRAFTQAIRTKTLEPGSAIETSVVWEDPHPGCYTAVATLNADVDVTAQSRFTV